MGYVCGFIMNYPHNVRKDPQRQKEEEIFIYSLLIKEVHFYPN